MRTGLLVLLFLVCGCFGENNREPNPITGEVISIADGDTFTLLTEQNRKVKIRMHGIDCPERRQDFGQVARQKLAGLIFRKHVRVQVIDVDRYNRTVGLVYDENNHCINEVMLKAGLAWHYKRYDTNVRWANMEQDARNRGAGIWSQPRPTAPWDWRK